MHLLAKFGSHRSFGNGDIISYISSYMNTLKKVALTASVRHFERFSKLGILIYNCKVPDTAGKKITRRGTQAIAKRYAIKANANIT